MRFLFLVATLIFSGCTWLIGPPADNASARQAVERLNHQNAALQQCKGLMHLQLQNDSQKLSARAAWAMAVPGRLRVELLNMLGQPMTSLASDGKFITIVSHTDQTRYRFIQSHDAFDRLIHLPIGVEELQSLLAGRPPLPPFYAAQLDGRVIVLKNRWRSTLARIFLDDVQQQVRMLKVYSEDGTLRYQVRWLQWQVVGPYTVPRRLQMAGAQGQRLILTVEKLWADAQLPENTFVLEPPHQKR